MFQSDVEEGEVTALHQLRRREVRHHRLVVLVLRSERVTKRQPGRSIHPVKRGRFARKQNKIFPTAQLKLGLLSHAFKEYFFYIVDFLQIT